MKRCADRQAFEQLRSSLFEYGLACPQILFRAGDDRLGSLIQIGNVNRVQPRCSQGLSYLFRYQADHRRHSTARCPGHESCSLLYQSNSSSKIEHAGCEKSVVLSETMTGDKYRQLSGLGQMIQKGQRIHHKQRGLSEKRLVQLVRRITQAEIGKGVSQFSIRDSNLLRKTVEEPFSHSNLLGTLSRENVDTSHVCSKLKIPNLKPRNLR